MKSLIFIKLILLFLLINSSCKMQINKQKLNTDIDCKKVQEIIKQIWHYNNETRVYEIETEDIPLFNEYRSCLYGKTENEIKSILGTPHKNYDYILTYYISKFCIKKPQKYCKEYNVFIDKSTGIVIKIHGSEYVTSY